jgi:preprotein translocase subunit YajC
MLNSILIATGEAAGQAAANTGAQGGSAFGGMSFMIPLLIVIVVMTFISGRSQRKQREKQQKMYDSLVKGTKVRTIGGFTGKIVEVGAETVMIELADKMPPVEIVKNAVAMVIDENAAADAKK